jgi:hypothetical protein
VGGSGRRLALDRTDGEAQIRHVTRRWPLALLLVVLGAAAVWLGWRWGVQTVDVVIVNASGQPGQLSWQPRLFADEVTVTVGGCESKVIRLAAGEQWQFDHGRLEMHSSVVDVPPFAREVAFEIWLDADGSSRTVAVHAVDGPVDAPIPSGCPSLGTPTPTPTADPRASPVSGVSIDCGPIVDRSLCLRAIDVALTAKVNPPPLVAARLRRPDAGDDCATGFHPCGPTDVIVELQSGDVIEEVPLVPTMGGGWARLDQVR